MCLARAIAEPNKKREKFVFFFQLLGALGFDSFLMWFKYSDRVYIDKYVDFFIIKLGFCNLVSKLFLIYKKKTVPISKDGQLNKY